MTSLLDKYIYWITRVASWVWKVIDLVILVTFLFADACEEQPKRYAFLMTAASSVSLNFPSGPRFRLRRKSAQKPRSNNFGLRTCKTSSESYLVLALELP